MANAKLPTVSIDRNVIEGVLDYADKFHAGNRAAGVEAVLRAGLGAVARSLPTPPPVLPDDLERARQFTEAMARAAGHLVEAMEEAAREAAAPIGAEEARP